MSSKQRTHNKKITWVQPKTNWIYKNETLTHKIQQHQKSKIKSLNKIQTHLLTQSQRQIDYKPPPPNSTPQKKTYTHSTRKWHTVERGFLREISKEKNNNEFVRKKEEKSVFSCVVWKQIKVRPAFLSSLLLENEKWLRETEVEFEKKGNGVLGFVWFWQRGERERP